MDREHSGSGADSEGGGVYGGGGGGGGGVQLNPL